MNKEKTVSWQNVDEWLSDILSQDATTFEDAYWNNRPPVDEAIPKIIQALDVYLDTHSRGKLIELLGECGNLSILPIIEKELLSTDEVIRKWAKGSIESLNNLESWQKQPKYL